MKCDWMWSISIIFPLRWTLRHLFVKTHRPIDYYCGVRFNINGFRNIIREVLLNGYCCFHQTIWCWCIENNVSLFNQLTKWILMWVCVKCDTIAVESTCMDIIWCWCVKRRTYHLEGFLLWRREKWILSNRRRQLLANTELVHFNDPSIWIMC